MVLLKFGAQTYVGSARGPEAGLADAGEGALGVHAAGVLTGIGAYPWLGTLVDVYAACPGVVQPEAGVAFTHGAQVGAHTPTVSTATLV